MQIKFFNYNLNKYQIEKVYGAKGIKLLYQTSLGILLSYLLELKFISKLYGYFQDRSISQDKIIPFIKKFNIDMSLFETSIQDNPGFYSFNDFFIRKFKSGKRNFDLSDQIFSAFCEARYFASQENNDEILLPVKGKFLRPKDLLLNSKWNHFFDGAIIVARLCPTDYHRFHYPVDCTILDFYKCKNKLTSVNPIALRAKPKTFIENERHVTILDSPQFGKLAYIEVGAMCVGKIIQSHTAVNHKYKKGQEKGYFLFGGSTVIVLSERGKLELDDGLLERSKQGIETLFTLGTSIGRSL